MNLIRTTLILLFAIFVTGSAISQGEKTNLLIQEARKVEQDKSLSVGNILARWLMVYNEIKDELDHPEFSNSCIAIADIYSREQLYNQALPFYLRALEVMQNSEPADIELEELHRRIAMTYTNKTQPDSAIIHYNIILQNKITAGNVNGQINTLRDILSAYTVAENYEKTLELNLRIKELIESNNYSNADKIKIYNNLGYNLNQLNDNEQSIQYFEKALGILPKEEYEQQAILQTNIGIAYYNKGEFEASIEYLLDARKVIGAHVNNKIDEIDQLLATVYLKNSDLYNALKHVEYSKKAANQKKHKELLVDVYYTAALIHSELYEYSKALDYFQQHLTLRDSFELVDQIRQQKLLLEHLDLERKEKEVKIFMINEDVKELTIAQLKVEKENQKLALQTQQAQLESEVKKKEILEKEKEILSKDNEIKQSQTEKAQKELELARQNLRVSEQEKAYAVLQQKEELNQLELRAKETELLSEQNEKALLQKKGELDTLELQKQKERQRYFYGMGLLLALIIFTIFIKNRAIEKQKMEINLEREKADGLLLNILPERVANELKETGKASTRKYSNVTILFTDFKGFTDLVATIPATRLVKELNEIFGQFDDIMDLYNLEKIETIGDAYMAACGLPEANPDHALNCINAAHAMLEFLKNRNKTSEIEWNMRVGLHSGPVVAGVVGKKKFAYDLFGDTVNTASRMESNGEAGRVNLSETTYELVKNRGDLKFENRGRIHAKGKGEMGMWFVS